MADIATRTAPTANGAGAPEPRQVKRRRSLPGSRAVVGGFLVAAAAVGTFGAYTTANAGPDDAYVVVTRDVQAGDRIGAGDLALVAVELPEEQRRTVLTDLTVATGAVAVGPLSEGQLLAGSDVVKLDGVVGRAQLSIPVEPARANNGELRRGELVDVIATYTSAGSAVTETIASSAVVVRVFTGEQSLGSSNSVVVTLSLTEAELEPVADAAAGATITIARVSGLERARPGSLVLDGVERDAVDVGEREAGDAEPGDGEAEDEPASQGSAPAGTAPPESAPAEGG